MEVVVALDPGMRRPGLAIFAGGTLVHAASFPEPAARRCVDRLDRAMSAAHLIYSATVEVIGDTPVDLFASEFPQIYGAGYSEVDPNTLLPMVLQIGALAALLACEQHRTFLPRDWTLGTSKDDGAKRRRLPSSRARLIGKNLTPREKQLYEGDADPDATDAIGIGLFALGRLRKGRVIVYE